MAIRSGLGGYSTMRNRQSRPGLGGVAMMPQQNSLPSQDTYGGVMAPQSMPAGLPEQTHASELKRQGLLSPGYRAPQAATQQPGVTGLGQQYGVQWSGIGGKRNDAKYGFGQVGPTSKTESIGGMSYMDRVRARASSAIAGQPASTGMMSVTPSQRNLLRGAHGSVNGVMAGDEQGSGPIPRPQNVGIGLDGSQKYGLPRYNSGFGGSEPKYYEGARTGDEGQISVTRAANGGLALKGSQSNPIDFNAPQYARARERAQAEKDNRLLANVQRKGLPMTMPNVQAALERVGAKGEGIATTRQAAKMQLARQSQLDDAIHAAHMAHAATLTPEKQIAYLQQLRGMAPGLQGVPNVNYGGPNGKANKSAYTPGGVRYPGLPMGF